MERTAVQFWEVEIQGFSAYPRLEYVPSLFNICQMKILESVHKQVVEICEYNNNINKEINVRLSENSIVLDCKKIRMLPLPRNIIKSLITERHNDKYYFTQHSLKCADVPEDILERYTLENLFPNEVLVYYKPGCSCFIRYELF